MKRFWILHTALCIFILIPFLASAGVKQTKHNLSVSGPGSVRAADETQICIFCHTPHNASPDQPLWNHQLSAVENYVNYFSNTLQSYSSEAEAPPIDGYSKLCLSCHDGTVAVGSLTSRYEDVLMEPSPCIDAEGRLVDAPGCEGYVGTNLSTGHPVSIVYDAALANKRNNAFPPLSQLAVPPLNDPDVKLYPTHGNQLGVQCPSCHDPHGGKAPGGWPPMWRKEGGGQVSAHDAVCIVCHETIPPGSITW